MTRSTAKEFLSRYGFWIVTLFALLFRLAYVVYYHQLPDWELLTVDNYYHHHWAETIADGNIVGDTTYFRAPLYVWCLGALYSLFGTSWWVGRLFGVLIGAASTGMTWMITRRLFSPTVALVAALIHACYPITVYHDGELLTDSLFTLTLQIALYYSLRWFDTKNPRTALWAGLALGLSALARPTSLILAPLIMLFAIWQIKNRTQVLQQVGLFVCGVVLIVSITFIRNLIVAGDPVLVASQGGINFYIGNNAEADGVSAAMPMPLGNTWQMAEVKHIAERGAGRSLKPGEISDYWFSQGIRWVREQPISFLGKYAIKLYRQIANFEIPNQRDLNQFLHKLPFPFYNPLCFGLIFAFAIWGIVASWPVNRDVHFLVWIVIIYMLATALFFVTSRFRLPILPIFFALSAFGAIAIVDQVRAKSRKAIVGGFTILAAGVVSFLPLFPLPNRTNVQEELSKASLMISEHNYLAAVTFAKQAVVTADTAMNTHLLLGIAYLRAGNTDSAIANLQTEIRRFPQNEKGYINLASAYLAADSPMNAEQCARQAIALAPYDITANQLQIRAANQDSTVDTSNFISICDSALERTNNDPFVTIDAGAMLSQRKSYALAEEILHRGLTSPPPAIETDDAAFERQFVHSRKNYMRQKAQIYFQLGFVAGLTRRYAESVSFSTLAIENDSTLRDAYINLINGYTALQHTSLADSVLHIAQTRFPNDQHLQQLRAR